MRSCPPRAVAPLCPSGTIDGFVNWPHGAYGALHKQLCSTKELRWPESGKGYVKSLVCDWNADTGVVVCASRNWSGTLEGNAEGGTLCFRNSLKWTISLRAMPAAAAGGNSARQEPETGAVEELEYLGLAQRNEETLGAFQANAVFCPAAGAIQLNKLTWTPVQGRKAVTAATCEWNTATGEVLVRSQEWSGTLMGNAAGGNLVLTTPSGCQITLVHDKSGAGTAAMEGGDSPSPEPEPEVRQEYLGLITSEGTHAVGTEVFGTISATAVFDRTGEIRLDQATYAPINGKGYVKDLVCEWDTTSGLVKNIARKWGGWLEPNEPGADLLFQNKFGSILHFRVATEEWAAYVAAEVERTTASLAPPPAPAPAPKPTAPKKTPTSTSSQTYFTYGHERTDRYLAAVQAQADNLEQIAAECSPESPFEDSLFAPGPSSLFHDPQNPPADGDNDLRFQWLRPREFCPGDPELFRDGAGAADVCQGCLGDCWFISAMAILAAGDEELLHKLVVSHEYADRGLYVFQFFKNGDWRKVAIDDRIPCKRSGSPAYASCPDPNEIWVPLMEKAYAKLHGNYEDIQSGCTEEGLRDLTGGASQDIDLEDHPEWGEEDVLRLITGFQQEGHLLGCSFSKGGEMENRLSNGLLERHAYSLLGTRTDIEGHPPLVKVRNPWGEGEWTGRYSDDDVAVWTPELMEALDHRCINDGTFWMSLEDFTQAVSAIEVCRLFRKQAGWSMARQLGEWTLPDFAAGVNDSCREEQNPQIHIMLETDDGAEAEEGSAGVPAFILLSQADARMNRGVYKNRASRSIGFLVGKNEEFGIRAEKLYYSTLVGKSGWCNSRTAWFEVSLLPGQSYVVVPTTFAGNEEAPFIVSVYARVAQERLKMRGGVELEEVPIDQLEAGGAEGDSSQVVEIDPMEDLDPREKVDPDTRGAQRFCVKLVAELTEGVAASRKQIDELIDTSTSYQLMTVGGSQSAAAQTHREAAREAAHALQDALIRAAEAAQALREATDQILVDDPDMQESE
ncbi:hypothetical protein CYMTET_15233 [Cymbomonas tetramitiformis]|uniref:Calpain catalytic domain-containing protein n=1 Tax=Cymbomonas tetramitiformis TaxID=36881 RepID=A0AAE0GEW0_9CHLO|nr:hypothetical protein CYMTET_15233 [Cymbomonas tetramitiformis]